MSNVTGEGVEAVEGFLEPRRTIVLLGSSGVGKSSLANRLAGRRLMPTGDVRGDGRGRHTTRHRQLLVLASGALLLDTPGLRELQIWEGDIDAAFADIAALAAECRFTDCAHDSEPECAIREALATGALDPDRWQSYLKLERELDRTKRRRGSREHQELKRRWRQRTREARQARRRGWKV